VPTRRKPVPSYLPHDAAKTRARAVWTDPTGTRRFRLLPGPFNSPESLSAFARLQAELAVAPAGIAPSIVTPAAGRTLAEVLLAFLKHAEAHYRGADDGRPTSEYREYRVIVRSLRELYGGTPADDFGPLALKAVRQKWVAAGLARSEVNRRVNMTRRLFKWAAGEELVRFDTFHRLTAVAGLQKGRTAARETDAVIPVDAATVDATLPHLNRHVAGVIEFQRLTGCRPGEACRVRPCDIDTAAPVWLYRPPHHKNAHRGKPRVVAIGPRAQALLAAFTPSDPTAYYFSPAAAVAEHHAARSAARKTPRYPSHMARNANKRVAAAKRPPAARYTPTTVSRAVARAVGRENTRREALAGAGNFDPLAAWHPNQLRHAHATEVRRRFGLEAAQVVLGHAKADVTQLYAERNTALAASVAKQIG
jgi:integrase